MANEAETSALGCDELGSNQALLPEGLELAGQLVGKRAHREL
jgi:hypothetical protein